MKISQLDFFNNVENSLYVNNTLFAIANRVKSQNQEN